MAIIRESPRVWNSTSTGPIVTASSGWNFQFGFIPQYVRIENLGTLDIWALFNSTGPATTDDILIKACEPARVREFYAPVCPSLISLGATSTVSNGASVLALGLP